MRIDLRPPGTHSADENRRASGARPERRSMTRRIAHARGKRHHFLLAFEIN
jgi:hypothetical protein